MNNVSSIKALLADLSQRDIDIWTDGKNLCFNSPAGSLTDSLRLRLSEHKLALVEHLRTLDREPVEAKFQPALDKPFPLDDMQQAYWIGETAGLELSAQARYYLEVETHEAQADVLAGAWETLVKRHAMLRCVLLPSGEQQVLNDLAVHPVECYDLMGLSAEVRHSRLDEIRQQMRERDLPTGQWPAFDFRISILPNGLRLHFRFNLWIIDGRSLQILLAELLSLSRSQDVVLPQLTLTARDYILGKAKFHNTDKHQKALEYWGKRLADLPQGPELPLAQQLDAVRKSRLRHSSARLTPEHWQNLREYARKSAVSPTFALCAAYCAILARWSRSKRFCITVLHSNRLPVHAQYNDIVGNFGSTILLEVDLSAPASFARQAQRLQAQFWRDLEHASVTGLEVVRQLGTIRNTNARTTFPVTFTSVTSEGEPVVAGQTLGLSSFQQVFSELQVPQVTLDHQVVEDAAGGMILHWDHAADVFPEGMVETMFAAYVDLLRLLAGNPDAWQVCPDLTPSDWTAKIAAVNATEKPFEQKLLHELFVDNVLRSPAHPAVIDASKSLSYRELYARAASLAETLRQRGARPNQLIAVSMEKGWEQVAAVLGILMSGAAYVPISPELPELRRNQLLAQSDALLLLTQARLRQGLACPAGIEVIAVDELEATLTAPSTSAVLQKPDDLAYVIFTSGSTGMPKGVMIDHKGAVNTVQDINQRFAVGVDDRVLALSALSFDLSVYDLFGILAAGGTVVFPDPDKTQEPNHWLERIQTHGITLWNTVPALMQLLVEHPRASEILPGSALRVAMLSGDWIPLPLTDQIKALKQDVSVISLGGATEASIWSIIHPIDQVDPGLSSIPYGRPMYNQQFFVLDELLRTCPAWVSGELYIGGIGLAKGYWKDEEKTRAGFIRHPLTGQRLYRTGDLGRYLPNAEIEFQGRADFQVKVNGYRIECAEIEAILLEMASVKAGIVDTVDDERGAKRLVAYVIPSTQSQFDAQAIREYLEVRLPKYMVPSAVLSLTEFPLSANGKVDRKALPNPDIAIDTTNRERVSPRDPMEKDLAQLWTQVLDLEQIWVTDNFFDLGGTSFSGMRLMGMIQERYGTVLPLTTLLDNPNIEALALHLRRREPLDKASTLVRIQSQGSQTPLFCIHPVGGNVLCYSPLARRLGRSRPFYGLQSHGLHQGEKPLDSIEAMAEMYLEEIRAEQPTGPYLLAGWSMGGIIAFEMAGRLQAHGEQVELLAMFDSHLPSPQPERPSRAQHLAAFARDLGGISNGQLPQSFDSLQELEDNPERQTDAFRQQLKTHGLIPEDVQAEQLQRLVNVFEHNTSALSAYQPPKYRGKAILFNARDSHLKSGSIGWESFAAQLEIHEIPGDHFTIMQEPHIAPLAQCLERLMPEMPADDQGICSSRRNRNEVHTNG